MKLDLGKKMWNTWIVGHLVNQKIDSKINQLFKCYLATNLNVQLQNMMTLDKPSVPDCGLWSVLQISSFAKLYIGTVGFIFIFCLCDLPVSQYV